jgi:hypothetical protein
MGTITIKDGTGPNDLLRRLDPVLRPWVRLGSFGDIVGDALMSETARNRSLNRAASMSLNCDKATSHWKNLRIGRDTSRCCNAKT